MLDQKLQGLKPTKDVSQQKSVRNYPALNKKLNTAAKKYNRQDTPLAPTPMPAAIDNTFVSKPIVRGSIL